MHQKSHLLKKTSFFLIIIGLIFMSFGFYKNFLTKKEKIFVFIKKHPKRFNNELVKNINEKKIKIIKSEIIDDLLKQVHNRPWSALYMASFYFTGISLGCLFFLSIQYASQSGWSIILIRIMEGISSFIPYGGLIILLILIFNSLGIVHMFYWMNDTSLYNIKSLNYDEIIANKQPFLNIPFYIFRSIIYILGWTLFMYLLKKNSKKLDQTYKLKYHKKLYNISVGFIVFFGISSMIMAWDWIMSLDPHWISTLFGWYVLGSYWISGITVITLISIYFKIHKYLPLFNNNHLHDLAKYMFATSFLWTYLWFAQFLLYWYGNIPEEVVYFINRSDQYNYIHFLMLIPNFLFPLLGLMSSNAKRNPKIIIICGCAILIGHIIDIYNMIMPSSVGGFYGFGASEIGSLFFVGGGFLFIVFKTLSRLELTPKGNFYFYESKTYKYPF